MYQYLITATLDFAVLFYALQSGSRAGKAAAFLAFCLGLWSIELFFLSYVENVDVLKPLFHFTRWGMFLAPTAFALFYLVLLGEKGGPYKKTVVLPSLGFSIALCVMNAFIFNTELKQVQGGYMPEVDWSYYSFVCLMLATMVSTVVVSIAGYRKSPKREIQKLAWTLLIGAFYLSAVVSTVVFIFTSDYLSKYVGSIVNLLFIAIVYYVVCPKLMIDFRRATVVLLGNGVVLVAFSVVNLAIISKVYSVEVTYASALTCSTVLAVMLLIYRIPVRAVSVWGGSFFAKGTYDADIEFANLQKILGACESLRDLEYRLSAYLVDRLALERVEFYFVGGGDFRRGEVDVEDEVVTSRNTLCDEAENRGSMFLIDEVDTGAVVAMKRLRYEGVVPVRNQGKFYGVIGLGRSLVARHYRSEDLFVFSGLEKALGVAVERLKKYEDFEVELADARKTLSVVSVMNQYHHDIKTPLAIIDGVVSTDLYDSEKQKEIVIEQVERGTKLIASMASLLKGKRQRQITQVNFTDVLCEAVALFENRFETVWLNVSPDLALNGDEIDLKILFSNIIKNAMESADPTRPITLTVNAKRMDMGVEVSFKDTGVGMDEEQLASIWQGLESTKPLGNGIGLQAIKRIADEHNAEIYVESKKGEGSEFKILFS